VSIVRRGLLRCRSIRHAELRAEVLGEQSDCVPIRVGISLHQILHGLDQQLLTLNVALIADSWSSAPLRVGNYREGK